MRDFGVRASRGVGDLSMPHNSQEMQDTP